MDKFLILFAGGGLGTVSRFLLSTWVLERLGPAFPYGTFSVNVVGCFLMGLVAGLPDNGLTLPPHIRLLFVIGFLGGFTTFSTYGYDAFMLASQGFPWKTLLYLTLTVITGFGAVFMGVWVMRCLLGILKGG